MACRLCKPEYLWLSVLMLFAFCGSIMQMLSLIMPEWLNVACMNNSSLSVGLWKICHTVRTVTGGEYVNCSSVDDVMDANILPELFTANKLLQCAGMVAGALTTLLTIIYSLAPFQVAISSANGLACAAFGTAAFIFVGILTVSAGKHDLESSFTRNICDIEAVYHSQSWSLAMAATTMYLVGGFIAISSSAMTEKMTPPSERHKSKHSDGLTLAENYRQKKQKNAP